MRRNQKGGFVGIFNPSEVQEKIVAQAPTGILPIPSQKRNICVSDSILVGILYSDFLREKSWNFLCDKSCQTDTYNTSATEAKLIRYIKIKPQNNSERLEVAKAYLEQGLVRIGHLIANTTPSMTRSESFENTTSKKEDINYSPRPPLPSGYKRVQPLDPAREGEKCALWLQAFSGRLLNINDLALPNWREKISLNLFKTIFNLPIFNGEFLVTQALTEGAGRPLCCILIEVEHSGDSHKICLSKINQSWYYCDNEIGFAVPIQIDTNSFESDLEESQFGIIGGPVRILTRRNKTSGYVESITEPREIIVKINGVTKMNENKDEDPRRVYVFGPPISTESQSSSSSYSSYQTAVDPPISTESQSSSSSSSYPKAVGANAKAKGGSRTRKNKKKNKTKKRKTGK